MSDQATINLGRAFPYERCAIGRAPPIKRSSPVDATPEDRHFMSILFYVAVACVLTAALLPVVNAILVPLLSKADK